MSYTSISKVQERVNLINNQLKSEWEKHDQLDFDMTNAQTRYNELLKELHYTEIDIAIININITNTQDSINELSLVKDDMLNAIVDELESEMGQFDDICEDNYDYDDYECQPKERKVRSDVLTVCQAVASSKSSKNHKLKPRSNKKDRSKSPEAKTQSKRVKASHM